MTIFYSDLDNFTEVYNDSSPFEVCDEMIQVDNDDTINVSDGDDAEQLLQDV